MDVWWFPTISYVKIGNHHVHPGFLALEKSQIHPFWDAWLTFPLRHWSPANFGTSQLHTCRKMLSTRLTGSSSHLWWVALGPKRGESTMRVGSQTGILSIQNHQNSKTKTKGFYWGHRPKNLWGKHKWLEKRPKWLQSQTLFHLSLDSELIKNGSKMLPATTGRNPRSRSFRFPPNHHGLTPSQFRLGSSVMAQRFRRRSMAFISWSSLFRQRNGEEMGGSKNGKRKECITLMDNIIVQIGDLHGCFQK